MPYSEEFKKLIKSVKKTYLGEPVPKKYQDKYGKVYDLNETQSIAYAIAKSKGVNTNK